MGISAASPVAALGIFGCATMGVYAASHVAALGIFGCATGGGSPWHPLSPPWPLICSKLLPLSGGTASHQFQCDADIVAAAVASYLNTAAMGVSLAAAAAASHLRIHGMGVSLALAAAASHLRIAAVGVSVAITGVASVRGRDCRSDPCLVD